MVFVAAVAAWMVAKSMVVAITSDGEVAGGADGHKD